MLRILSFLLFPSCVAIGAASFPEIGPAPQGGGFHMDGYWVWDASVTRDEAGRYHLFASRWPRTIPFHPGWMTSSEVIRAVSDTPGGPYTFQEVVLPARGAEYWDGRSTHNPRVVRSGDTYLLYYMGSTHPFDGPEPGEPFPPSDPRCIVARSNKRIGLATAKSLEGPWTRRDAPILETKPGTYYSFLTSNPSPIVREDGSIDLIFKSRAYTGNAYGKMNLGMARAASPEGPYEVVTAQPIFSEGNPGVVEDPFVWKTPAGYELIAKDMEGYLCGEKYGGVHARSADGVQWKVAGKAWSLTLPVEGRGLVRFAHVERPFIFFEDGKPAWLFVVTGNDTFEKMTSTGVMAFPLR